MSKIIVDNQSDLSDARALKMCSFAIQDTEIIDYEGIAVYKKVNSDDLKISAIQNKESVRLVVYK